MAHPESAVDLAESLKEIFDRLDAWREFPKYALERRLDIFLTPFLEPYLTQRMEAPVTLVAPEFPLKREGNARSTNVDYLLHRDGDRPAWIFLELKTDARSFREAQLEVYRAASGRGLAPIVQDIEREIIPRTRQRRKYERLVAAVRAAGSLEDSIEIAYLSPEPPDANDSVAWFSFKDFGAWTPTVHQHLWARLQPLLAALQPGTDE